MQLLIIRHAIAADRDEFAETGKPDSERPLTDEGRAKMRDAVRGLRAAVPDLDLLATSPFARARQTADIVAGAYKDLAPVEVGALASGGSRTELLAWLQRQQAETVAVVGHEPDLGVLIGWLVTGEPEPIAPLKKGGTCLLAFEGAPEPGRGHVAWLLTPRILRLLGDR